ncbi:MULTISPECIES: hypothetical protein [Clostridium]|uniref:hypothetical protein n=1 Tax=Clostridium TaxID=1485 RepID=UPI00149468C5|nr:MULTISPECIES: hypothetical protein [Clostridium]MBC2482886.1 hypothetical protein [Clostridium saccharobutylicum]NOW08103.1 hypothetical protein [Clostridium beijerinckii]NYC05789.1 hypothetical protein [Clostridium beijerinckii]CAI9912341.1 Major coat protein [Clostridium phage CAK1]
MLQKLKSKANKIALTTSIVTMSALNMVAAHADDDMTAITGAVTTGISNTKTEFMALLAVVVGGAMAFFAVKYAVNNGIGFFAKISKKG